MDCTTTTIATSYKGRAFLRLVDVAMVITMYYNLSDYATVIILDYQHFDILAAIDLEVHELFFR